MSGLAERRQRSAKSCLFTDAMAADKKKPARVSDSPIQDVFEGWHPSSSEKEWAEKTLAPALEKAPERPIGGRLASAARMRASGEFLLNILCLLIRALSFMRIQKLGNQWRPANHGYIARLQF